MIGFEAIPTSPGCYIFKDKEKNIIYVGKAKNLKKRVSSYFQKKDHDPKTQLLVENIDKVDFIATDNEVEALILENTLIKKHKPKYNINLRDSKTFAYLLLTDEEFPRLLVARNKEIDAKKGRLFGPFVSAAERDYIRELLIRTFKLRTCKKMPKRPCLRHHINLCDAPCAKSIDKVNYDEKIKKVTMVLKGKTDELIKKLKEEMKISSDAKNFEKSLLAREEIHALEGLSHHQKMERNKKYDEDIINYIIKGDKIYLILFNIYKGTLANKNEFVFDYMENFLEDFIVQYYSENEIPKEIILPIEVDSSIKGFLEKKKNERVNITIPKIAEKKHLLDLVIKNIELSMFGDLKKLEALKERLRMQSLPQVIECLDISHLSGTSMVGSMVQFRNGKPDKINYRRFKIKTLTQIDDFAAIAEVVRRRYERLKNENASMPDLIIIDGGKGQLSSAMEELKKLELKIPLISIAKQFEEVYVPGLSIPIRMDRKDKALQFVQEIRDEAHRFAIKYNRLLRKNELVKDHG